VEHYQHVNLHLERLTKRDHREQFRVDVRGSLEELIMTYRQSGSSSQFFLGDALRTPQGAERFLKAKRQTQLGGVHSKRSLKSPLLEHHEI